LKLPAAVPALPIDGRRGRLAPVWCALCKLAERLKRRRRHTRKHTVLRPAEQLRGAPQPIDLIHQQSLERVDADKRRTEADPWMRDADAGWMSEDSPAGLADRYLSAEERIAEHVIR
jgi:hypothetical protein